MLREDQLMTGQWKMAARKKEKMESMFGEDLSEQLGLKEYQEFPVLELSQLPKTTHEFFLR